MAVPKASLSFPLLSSLSLSVCLAAASTFCFVADCTVLRECYSISLSRTRSHVLPHSLSPPLISLSLPLPLSLSLLSLHLSPSSSPFFFFFFYSSFFFCCFFVVCSSVFQFFGLPAVCVCG